MSSDDVMVRVEGLAKSYQLQDGLLGRVRRLFAGRREEPRLYALKDLSFTLKRGESLGVVGRNGAGKSTLLKVLAGVTWPTAGGVATNGRLFPMIELSAGLNRELTGRENVHLLGAIMGLTRAAVEERMGDIEEFCELGRFFDVPIRKYSSGMLSRLGFAVAVNVEPEILLVDEVLAVGDPGFQQKCYGRILRMLDKGVTLILVSHAFRQIGRLCEKTLWLDRGTPKAYGPTEEVLLEYMNTLQEAARASVEGDQALLGNDAPPGGNGAEPAHVLSVALADEADPAAPARTGAPATIAIEYRLEHEVPDAFFVVQVFSQDNLPIASFSSREAPANLPAGPGVYRCRLPRLQLLPGVYLLNASIGRLRSNEKLTRGYRQDAATVLGEDFGTFESRTGYFAVDVEWPG